MNFKLIWYVANGDAYMELNVTKKHNQSHQDQDVRQLCDLENLNT